MAPRYALARLHGGPLDGDLMQAPLNQWRMPADVIGVPVPVLDEQTETRVASAGGYGCAEPGLADGWSGDFR